MAPKAPVYSKKVLFACGALLTIRSDSERALVRAALKAVREKCPACLGVDPNKRHIENVGKDVWLVKPGENRV